MGDTAVSLLPYGTKESKELIIQGNKKNKRKAQENTLDGLGKKVNSQRRLGSLEKDRKYRRKFVGKRESQQNPQSLSL